MDFGPPMPFPVGAVPQEVAVADLNGNGIPDVVASNRGGASVSALLGVGDGNLQPAGTFRSGGELPQGIAIGDVNGDGIPDLVVANFGANNVALLLGNGDGTFQLPRIIGQGIGCHHPILADFRGVGILDVAVTDQGSGSVIVMLGNGDGTFQPGVRYATGRLPTGLIAGDFAGNGAMDLAVVNSASDTVSVLLNNGDGTFQAAVNYPVGAMPMSVGVADVTGDGILDLVVADMGRTGQDSGYTVLPGNGDGTFIPLPPRICFGWRIWDIWPDWIRPDPPIWDLVVTDTGGDRVGVLLNDGQGNFSDPIAFDVGGHSPANFAVADMNGDGLLDLVVANAGSNSVSVLLNDGVWAGGIPGRNTPPFDLALTAAPAQPARPAPAKQPADSEHPNVLFVVDPASIATALAYSAGQSLIGAHRLQFLPLSDLDDNGIADLGWGL
jgi:hypothetical protein